MDPSQQKPQLPEPGVGAPALALVAAWAAVVAGGGGYACGLLIDRYGEFGSISVWPLGVIAGLVGRKMLPAPSQVAGVMIITAVVFAGIFAETCWIHWNLVKGADSWLAAFLLLPRYAQQSELTIIIAALFTIFGASSGYRQIAARFVKVPV